MESNSFTYYTPDRNICDNDLYINLYIELLSHGFLMNFSQYASHEIRIQVKLFCRVDPVFDKGVISLRLHNRHVVLLL